MFLQPPSSGYVDLRPDPLQQPVQTFDEILSLVARGRIVYPTSSAVPIFTRDDVGLIAIDDLPHYYWVWSGALAGIVLPSAHPARSLAQRSPRRRGLGRPACEAGDQAACRCCSKPAVDPWRRPSAK